MCKKTAAHRSGQLKILFLETNDTIVQFQRLAVSSKSVAENVLVHNRIPPIKSGRKTVRVFVVFLKIVLKVPGAAVHFDLLAVSNDHFAEIILNSILHIIITSIWVWAERPDMFNSLFGLD